MPTVCYCPRERRGCDSMAEWASRVSEEKVAQFDYGSKQAAVDLRTLQEKSELLEKENQHLVTERDLAKTSLLTIERGLEMAKDRVHGSQEQYGYFPHTSSI